MPSQADALTLYSLLSNFQADTNLFPLFYQDVMNTLGKKHWHTKISPLISNEGVPTVTMPLQLLDLLTVFYSGQLISRLTLRQLYTLIPGWRTAVGTPITYTIEAEESKTIEVYPAPFARSTTDPTIIYAENRTNSLPYLTLPIALKCLAREFVRESNHTDATFAKICDELADMLFGMLESHDNQPVEQIMTPLHPSLGLVQQQCELLVAFISDGKADLTLFPQYYSDVMNVLGMDLWHTTATPLTFTAANPVVALPNTLLDFVAVLGPDGTHLSKLELREFEAVRKGWRVNKGNPVMFTTESEMAKQIEVAPPSQVSGKGTILYAENRPQALPYLTLPIALLILERDFSRGRQRYIGANRRQLITADGEVDVKETTEDQDFATICGQLGRYLLEQMSTDDNAQKPEADEPPEEMAVMK